MRALDGKAPELYIANLRNSGADGKGGKIEGADQFLAKRFVVALLPGADHLLDRQPTEKWMPAAEDQGLPEAPEAAIAICGGLAFLDSPYR